MESTMQQIENIVRSLNHDQLVQLQDYIKHLEADCQNTKEQ